MCSMIGQLLITCFSMLKNFVMCLSTLLLLGINAMYMSTQRWISFPILQMFRIWGLQCQVTDNLDITNGFNNFFVSIGPNLKSDIDPLSYVNNNINSNVVQEVSCSQVREVINSLNNSSPGHDELPPFVAKACIDEFIKPITHMVNESLKSGVFPTELKLARVVPIFKSGDPSLLSNYRPISVLSFFSKTFEKMVYNLVFDFLSDNEVLYDYQYSTSTHHTSR